MADATLRMVDEEVERMVTEAQADALELLADDRPRLDALAEALLDRGSLEPIEIVGVLRGIERRPFAVAPVPRATAHARRAPEAREQPRTPVRAGAVAGGGRLVAAARWLESRPRYTTLRPRRRVVPAATGSEDTDPVVVTQSG